MLAKFMPEDTHKPLFILPDPSSDESKAPGGAERRRMQRLPFTAAAEVVEMRSQARVTGRSADLGPGGCYVDTISPFPVGSVVRVRLERDLREFEAAAVVTYALVSMGMGMSFTEIKPEHQAVLRTWIAELSGEPLPDQGTPESSPEEGVPAGVAHLRQVINELISLMVRKKLISENEAAGLLRQMFR